jgi:hypothetical protein
MSERKSIGLALATHFTKVRGSAGRIVAGAIALSALRLVSLMDAPNATASYAVAFALGGLLLIGAMTATRGVQKARQCPAESKRARVQAPRFR